MAAVDENGFVVRAFFAATSKRKMRKVAEVLKQDIRWIDLAKSGRMLDIQITPYDKVTPEMLEEATKVFNA